MKSHGPGGSSGSLREALRQPANTPGPQSSHGNRDAGLLRAAQRPRWYLHGSLSLELEDVDAALSVTYWLRDRKMSLNIFQP